mmetsp:Transcript_23436/g.56939  ORF Transcript_23436/g.56939 Transcript_23436/m.56939 type:complete len:124 (-) Transcript_23436:99-470(-)
MDTEKLVRIKTGVVKRTHKELLAYVQEEKDQRDRIELMKGSGQDVHDIKQQQEVLNDTLNVLPDTMCRLQKAHEDLADILVDASMELGVPDEIAEGVELTEQQSLILDARAALAAAEKVLPAE